MSESTLLEATVEAVSKAKTGIKIGDDWYNIADVAAQNPGVNKGDKVKFKWSQGKNAKGQEGKQIRTKVVVVEKAPAWNGNKGKGGGFKGGGGGFKKDPQTQASIESQACLKAACELVAATLTGKSNPEDAAKMAAKITKEVFLPLVREKAPEEAAKAAPAAKAEPKKAAPLEELEELDTPAGAGIEDFDNDTPF